MVRPSCIQCAILKLEAGILPLSNVSSTLFENNQQMLAPATGPFGTIFQQWGISNSCGSAAFATASSTTFSRSVGCFSLAMMGISRGQCWPQKDYVMILMF